MAVIVPIVSKFDDKGIKNAQNSFGKLGGALKGLVGGFALSAVVSQITDMAKAAGQDAKSQALLAQQMRNVTGASDAQITSVEDAINKMSNQTGILDDELRPAMSNLVRATGDVTKAQDLLALSTDVAAATGKDLGAVSQALGKAVNGQTTALFKMIPSLKDSSNWMEELRLTTQGMAESAANADPFSRLQVTMDNIQEQIGTAFLPMFEELANYLASDSFQGGVDSFVAGLDRIGSAVDYIGQKIPWLQDIVDKLMSSMDNGNWINRIGLLGLIIQGLSNLNQKPTTSGTDETQRLIARKVDKYRRAATPVVPDAKGGGKSGADAAAAAAKAAAEIAKKFADAYKKILETEKQIAADALDAAITSRSATIAMRDSFAALYDGVKPLQRAAMVIGEFEQQVVDSFQAIEDQIASSLADGTLLADAAANLRAYAASEKATLSAIARQRDALTKKIEIAKSISAGVLALGDVTTLLDKQTRTVTETFTRMVDGVTVATTRSFDEITQGGLVDNFKKVIEKTKAFAKNLIELKRLGLNGQLFKQIVSAGVEAGGDTAQAIADGGAATVTELNDLFGQLNDLGGQVAAASTDVMYQAGEDVMNSFIQSLLDQDKALEDTATSLATKFAEAFRNTLVALSPLMALPMNTSDISLSDALNGYVSDQLGRTFTGPYNYYGQQMVGGLGANYNVTINAGAVADKASLPGIIVDALATYTRTSGSGALNKVLSI